MPIREGKRMVLNKEISPKTLALGLYFILMAADIMRLGKIGSVLRIAAVFPLLFAFFDLKELKIRLNALMFFPIVFMLIEIASLFWSVDTVVTIKYILSYAMNLMLFLVMGVLENYNEKETDFLIGALVLGSWLTILLTLLFSDLSVGGRLTLNIGGSLQDPNALNGYMMFAFVWHFSKYFEKRQEINIVLSALIVFIALYTGSRGAILSFGAVFVLICIMQSTNTRDVFASVIKLLLLIGAISVLVLLARIVLPGVIFERFTPSYLIRKGSTGRTKIWSYLWDVFINSSIFRQLFGNGYGTTTVINGLNHRVAHNLYLDNLISVGIVGCFIQITLQLSYFFWLLKARQTVLLSIYFGYIVMCFSLSLTSYKPMWNVMLVTTILSFIDRKSVV